MVVLVDNELFRRNVARFRPDNCRAHFGCVPEEMRLPGVYGTVRPDCLVIVCLMSFKSEPLAVNIEPASIVRSCTHEKHMLFRVATFACGTGRLHKYGSGQFCSARCQLWLLPNSYQ